MWGVQSLSKSVQKQDLRPQDKIPTCGYAKYPVRAIRPTADSCHITPIKIGIIADCELMKVMIVDDHPSIRRTIKALLSDLVATFHECEDGIEALVAYERHRPELVLMDIKLGEMDGITAARRIRDRHPDCRIVMVTNYDDEGLRKAASKAGAYAYVLKENLLELRASISELNG